MLVPLRDSTVLNEYGSLTGYVFARLYALDTSDIGRVFPSAPPGKYLFL